ncbi:hypothetical protein [Vibrio phage phiKT1024]|nr:hypothetical protein [Vibrio phage phiKT1024]
MTQELTTDQKLEILKKFVKEVSKAKKMTVDVSNPMGSELVDMIDASHTKHANEILREMFPEDYI